MSVNKIIYATKKFGSFDVHHIKDNHTFFYIDIINITKFYSGLFNFILDENNLLNYAQSTSGIKFTPSKKNFATLYRHLYYYIDSENSEKDLSELDSDLATILQDEFDTETKNDGRTIVRLSKIGRIGEYIFHIFLSQFFNFNCIIPKLKLTTDSNMSVYGIDTLHLAKEERMILFGESKVTKNIENGINLINRSLKHYEKDIRDEFMLVLSNQQLKSDVFKEIFGDVEELCINFVDFIEKAELEIIGIPIFIAHGDETDITKILEKLESNLKRLKFFGLETRYYIISLPIINKNSFVSGITKQIRLRMDKYEYELGKL
ncbi:MAG: hypothetical protein JWM44_4445 [Bacilli bacterium]|nr:hypothetical protein [Bacilli bacterium]